MLTVSANRSLVSIGLGAYAAIGMLAPGVFLAFLNRRVSPVAIMGGMAAGYASLLVPAATRFWQTRTPEWDEGLIALIINLVVVGLITVAARSVSRREV